MIQQRILEQPVSFFHGEMKKFPTNLQQKIIKNYLVTRPSFNNFNEKQSGYLADLFESILSFAYKGF